LTPGLRNRLQQSLEEVYRDGRRAAVIGLEVDQVRAEALPVQSPYTLEQILDPDWLPKNVQGIQDKAP
jgi:hypothetical protein